MTHSKNNIERRITVIRQIVAQETGISLAQLDARLRTGPVAQARQIGMYFVREHAHASYLDSAKAFNKTDHGTAMHAYKKISAQRTLHQDVRAQLDDLSAKILRAFKQANL